MTLIEIVVVMALFVALFAVAIPSYRAIFDINLRGAAKDMGQTFKWLQDEAAMRDVTFRVAINLDRNSWKVEVGDSSALVYSTPEEREEAQEALAEAMRRYTDRELEEDPEAQEEIAALAGGKFTGLTSSAFTTEQVLPNGTAFAWVYTPQYGEDGIVPSGEGPHDDPMDDTVAYVHVFPDGTAEHAVIRIVDADDIEDGWTIEVEPLSGKVNLTSELVDPEDSLSWIPEEGPTI